MRRPLSFTSDLAASAAEVWAEVSTMQGVNFELMPFLRMTHPDHVASLESVDLQPGRVLFKSWLLLFGLIPLDLHALALEALVPGEGFDERSSSWMQREWVHKRRVEALNATSCRVIDELQFQPRVPLATPMLRVIVAALFQHRHRRLQTRFGSANS